MAINLAASIVVSVIYWCGGVCLWIRLVPLLHQSCWKMKNTPDTNVLLLKQLLPTIRQPAVADTWHMIWWAATVLTAARYYSQRHWICLNIHISHSCMCYTYKEWWCHGPVLWVRTTGSVRQILRVTVTDELAQEQLDFPKKSRQQRRKWCTGWLPHWMTLHVTILSIYIALNSYRFVIIVLSSDVELT